MTGAGTANALRLITKNLLVIDPLTGGTIDWIMGYLVVPLPEPVPVRAGDGVGVRFDYAPGDEIPALLESLRVTPPGTLHVDRVIALDR